MELHPQVGDSSGPRHVTSGIVPDDYPTESEALVWKVAMNSHVLCVQGFEIIYSLAVYV